MIIDFHTHCFPDALAPRAMDSLNQSRENYNFIFAHTDGTANGAKARLQSDGIDHAVVCNIATNTHQETKVNSFAISLTQDDFFSPLGSLHPDSEQMVEELDRLTAAGIRGIKIHPDYVRIPISDKRFDKIFSLLEERGMFCVLHTGFDPISPELVHATPEMLADTVKKHPRLSLIAAHMGGFWQAKGVLRHLVGKNIYLDTSLCSLREGEREELYTILQEHDENRLLFGTDTPWSDPRLELTFLRNAPISSSCLEKILSQNAMRLLGKA